MTAKSKSPRPARDTMPRRQRLVGRGALPPVQLLFLKYSRRRRLPPAPGARSGLCRASAVRVGLDAPEDGSPFQEKRLPRSNRA
jgi:hypothetical protein